MGTWTTLLIPVNGDVKEVFSAQIAADDKGACGPGPEDEIACYSSKMSLRFVRGNNPDYDDIELRLSGTDRVPGKPYRKRSVSGFQRLAFKDTRYITIEKQGDQTSDGTGEDDHTK